MVDLTQLMGFIRFYYNISFFLLYAWNNIYRLI